MEVYTLDSLLRRARVVDTFETCIWTERYSEHGDFELHVFSTFEMRGLLTAGTRLALNESKRIMTVETVENTLDSDGRSMIKLTGRSLEAILKDRVNRYGSESIPVNEKWSVTGTPGYIARTVFDTYCRNNTLNPTDNLPFLVVGSIYPASTIEEPDEVITVEFEYGTVYDSLKQICDAYKLGFRLVRNLDTSQLYFDVYSGNDHTTLQQVLPPVVFSPELDNLADISELTSIEQYKNVAYVYAPMMSTIVYADGASEDTTGFQRRVVVVDASDVSYPDRPYTWTTAQEASMNAGINLATNSQGNRDAMNTLLNKKRLTAYDTIYVNQVIASSVLTSPQKSDITVARDTANNYDPTEDAIIYNILVQRGKDELSKNRSLSAFDGEIPQFGSYRYAWDYELGDLVEMRNQDGVTNNMRVTEQIFVSDEQGDRSYPTLAIDQFIMPGSWLAWDYNQVWEEAAGVWFDA